jgi:hypothetical protein
MSRRPAADYDAAFIAFAAMPKGQRTIKRVASELDIQYALLRKVAGEDKWTQRAADLDRKALAKAEKGVIREHAKRMEVYLQVVDEYLDKFLAHLKSGKLAVNDPNALVGMLKLAMVHAGEATERVEVREVREVLVAWLDVVLPRIAPEERGELVATLRERVGQHLPPEVTAGE